MDEPDTKQLSAESANDWGSPVHVHALVLMVATGIGVYLCYWMTVPFLPALAWALALAVLFVPLHRRIESRLKRPTLAAMFSVLAVALIVVVPAIFVANEIVGQAVEGADSVRILVESGRWRHAFDAHPQIAPIGHWLEKHFDLPGLIQSAASWLTSAASGFVQGSVVQVIGIVLTFYILFYFLRDRSVALQLLRSLSPLSRADMNRLFSDVFNTVNATVYGTLAVAVVQGTLGGLMFWWLGLPVPLLWGLVMGLFAVVPVLGAFIIWMPAAVFLLLDGSPWKALVLTVWGAVVVGGIDNLLYPMLVGNRLKMHTFVAFVSIVGGLIVFGGSGLILGPVIFTVTRFLLEIWRSRNAIADA